MGSRGRAPALQLKHPMDHGCLAKMDIGGQFGGPASPQVWGGGGAVCRWGTGVIIMCGEECSNSKNPDTVE